MEIDEPLNDDIDVSTYFDMIIVQLRAMCIESPKMKNNYTAQILLRKVGEYELADKIDAMLEQPFIIGSDMTVRKAIKILAGGFICHYDNEKFLLREIEDSDVKDLLKVYSDKDAVPLFNSDNCVNGFYYTSIKEMKDTIEFWKREYQNRYYVRWAIIDKNANQAIGTIELFNRRAKDYFNNCGLLRLDLRSDYEKQDIIEDILGIIIPETKDMFACEIIATKAIPIAEERIKALE